MGSVPFQDGDGNKRFTDVIGTGTSSDPYIFIFRFPDGYNLPITLDANTALQLRDGNVAANKLTIDSSGRLTILFVDETAAPLPSSASGIIGLIRGLWGSVVNVVGSVGNTSELSSSTGSLHAKLRFFIADTFGATGDAANMFGSMMARVRSLAEAIGTSADASSSTGSLMARIRLLLVDTIGATADAANADASLMARIRLVAISFNPITNNFVRSGATGGTASVTDTISASPSRLLRVYCYNKSSSVRFLQFFNRNTNPTSGTTVSDESFAVPPNSVLFLGRNELGSNGLNFATGLAWAFSTTELIYTAAQNSEVGINIKWRSI